MSKFKNQKSKYGNEINLFKYFYLHRPAVVSPQRTAAQGRKTGIYEPVY